MSASLEDSSAIPEPQIYSDLVKLARCGDTSRVNHILSSSTPQPSVDDEEIAPVPPISAKDVYNCSSLVWSVRNGYVKMSEFLLEKEADAESNSFGGMKVRLTLSSVGDQNPQACQ